MRVIVAGGGVAALETGLALRAPHVRLEARFLGPLLERRAALTDVKNLRVAAGLS